MTINVKTLLREELLARYETSAGEYFEEVEGACASNRDPVAYRCRRCLRRVGLDNGSDDLAGLCDDCWCEVDLKFRGGGRYHGR